MQYPEWLEQRLEERTQRFKNDPFKRLRKNQAAFGIKSSSNRASKHSTVLRDWKNIKSEFFAKRKPSKLKT